MGFLDMEAGIEDGMRVRNEMIYSNSQLVRG